MHRTSKTDFAKVCNWSNYEGFAMKSTAALLCWATTSILAQHQFRPEIPKTWDTAALATLEVPHPDSRYSPVAVPVEYYYRVPVRPVYKTYPVYAPGREPAH